MLLYAATLDGQSAVAIQAAKDLAKVAETHAFYYPVVLATFGRWDEVPDLSDPPTDPFERGMWLYARGMAYLRTGNVDFARQSLHDLQSIIADLPESSTFRRHPQSVLLEIPSGLLMAELSHQTGDSDEAIRILRETVAVEDNLEYDEPEPWHLPVRHVLGAVLLESGHAEEAEAVYREGLERLPRDGWALFGLEQALRAQGKTYDADEVGDEFERTWARSDVWLRSSRF
jgi:tetratricopeptide (TPR) repeat protein